MMRRMKTTSKKTKSSRTTNSKRKKKRNTSTKKTRSSLQIHDPRPNSNDPLRGGSFFLRLVVVVVELKQSLERFEKTVRGAVARLVAQRFHGRVHHLRQQPIGKLTNLLSRAVVQIGQARIQPIEFGSLNT